MPLMTKNFSWALQKQEVKEDISFQESGASEL